MLNQNARKIIDTKLKELSQSKFRKHFSLHQKEKKYFAKVGEDKIKEHAYDFIKENLAPAYPLHDGAQTPMKNHPVFIAQHATATCCRSCLEKWHHIPKGQELTPNQINYIVELIMAWIRQNKE